MFYDIAIKCIEILIYIACYMTMQLNVLKYKR